MINTWDVVDILKNTKALGEKFTFNDEQYILVAHDHTRNDRITLTFEKTKHTISPCPFCGSVDSLELADGVEGYFVVCGSCRCEGPIGTKQQAILKWNQAQA